MKRTIVGTKLIRRFLSICIDFLLFSLVYYLIFSFCFNKILDGSTYENKAATSQYYAGLLVENDEGYYTLLNTSDYVKYEEIVEDYYLNGKYFNSSWYKDNNGIRSAYTIEQYNDNILYLGTAYTYFEYDYDSEGKIDKTKKGVYSKSLYIDEDKEKGLSDAGKANLLSFYSTHYKEIFTDLYNDSFYSNWKKEANFIGVEKIIYSFYISYILVYIIPPLTNKWGYSLGRFILKIGIIHKSGYMAKKWQFLIRNIPMLIIGIVPFIKDDLVILGSVVGVYFLLNWLITIMNRNNYSLLDYISLSRVIDIKESDPYLNFDEFDENEYGNESE